MGIKVINEDLFGYETPLISHHCMVRYTQRFLGIDETYSIAYVKTNKGRIVKEILTKIPQLKETTVTEEKLKSVQKKYGNSQMRFLLYRDKLMFVVQRELNRNLWIIKTCYRT